MQDNIHMHAVFVIMIAMVWIMLTGCAGGGGGDSTPDNQWSNRIRNWQASERLLEPAPEFFGGYTEPGDITEALNSLRQAYQNPVYTAELNGTDHWQTSQETAVSMRGDCEDIAIYWYSIVREAQTVADHKLTLQILQNDRGFHAVLRIALDEYASVYFNNGQIKGNVPGTVVSEFDLWNIYQ